MSAGIRQAALVYSSLAKRDRRWLLKRLDPQQRYALIAASERVLRDVPDLPRLGYQQILPLINGDGGARNESVPPFLALSAIDQTAIVSLLSTESVWALSHWKSWNVRDQVLSQLPPDMLAPLRQIFKTSKSGPTDFYLDSIIEYVNLRAEK